MSPGEQLRKEEDDDATRAVQFPRGVEGDEPSDPDPEGVRIVTPPEDVQRETRESQEPKLTFSRGMASLAALRVRDAEAPSWNADTAPAMGERTFGVLSATSYGADAAWMRTITNTLLGEAFAPVKIPPEARTDAGAAEQYVRSVIARTHEAVAGTARDFEKGEASAAFALVHLMEDASGRSYAIVGSSGDNRVYHVRRGDLTLLTKDQSKSNSTYVGERDLTGGIGVDGSAPPEMRKVALEPGDLLFVTSRDLAGNVTDDEMEKIIARVGADPEAVATALTDAARANSHGPKGHDGSMTAVAVRIETAPVASAERRVRTGEQPTWAADLEARTRQWKAASSMTLDTTAMSYHEILHAYESGAAILPGAISEVAGLRDAYQSAMKRGDTAEIMRIQSVDRAYKEAALDALATLMASRAGVPFPDRATYEESVDPSRAAALLADYSARLEILDPRRSAYRAPEELRAAMSGSLRSTKSTPPEQTEAFLFLNREHLRRRIAQLRRATKRAA
ncbi:hypothetical protein HY480_02740 [Candidatus Uhrbacteria bacterium]|nr:hypothetical protein [Candidatus Uhrbacteria bacterium]